MSNPTTTGEWTAKQASHGWYVEFDAMNGACIDNELTAKGIANAHNAALAAERERSIESMKHYDKQLAAEREVGGNTAISLAQQITKLEDQLAAAMKLLGQARYDAGDNESMQQEKELRAKIGGKCA